MKSFPSQEADDKKLPPSVSFKPKHFWILNLLTSWLLKELLIAV